VPAGAAGAELPLHRRDPPTPRCAHRHQHGRPRQEPVDQRRARRAGRLYSPTTSATGRLRGGTLHDWIAYGGARRECAILYRSNAQSRVFEEALIQARHALPRLRAWPLLRARGNQGRARLPQAVANRDDDGSFERVVNLPDAASARTPSILAAKARAAPAAALWRAAGRPWRRLGHAARRWRCWFPRLDRAPRARSVRPRAARAGGPRDPRQRLIEHHQKDKADRGEARVENLEELVSAAAVSSRGRAAADGELPRARGARIGRSPGRPGRTTACR